MNTQLLRVLRNIARFCSTPTVIQAAGFVLATAIGICGFRIQKGWEYERGTCDHLAKSVGNILGDIKVLELLGESPSICKGDDNNTGSGVCLKVKNFYVYYYGQSLVLKDEDLKKLGEFHRALEHYLTGYGNVGIVELGMLSREFVGSCFKKNVR